MTFLISGMVRCRSAWLTALLNAHGIRTYHDILNLGKPLYTRGEGVCDPAIAMLHPAQAHLAYAGLPTVCLYADDHEDRMDALDRWSGHPLSEDLRRKYRVNYALYAENTEYQVNVEDLDDNDVVGDLINYVSGMLPDYELIDIFQLLKIEEHWEKSLALGNKRGK